MRNLHADSNYLLIDYLYDSLKANNSDWLFVDKGDYKMNVDTIGFDLFSTKN